MTATRAAVTGCNLKFAPGAIALLEGLRTFHPDVRRYCFVPADEVGEARVVFGDLAEVLAPPRRLAGVPDVGHLAAHLSRFFVPTVPADVVAWFDCDMVVCRPIGEVWDVAPGRVRAVTDHSASIVHVLKLGFRERFVEAFPDSPGVRGFNAGMFALRPADWPDLPERFERALASCRRPDDDTRFPSELDQPVLNLAFRGRVDHLPIEFNAHCVFDHPIPADVRMVHFTSPPKPWMPAYPRHEPAYYYWLRYGVREERFWPLARTKLRIWLRTPRRVASRLVRDQLRAG